MSYATAANMRRIVGRLRARGVTVIEVPGWDSRGHGAMGVIQAVVCHHTAGAKNGDYPSLAIVRDGRTDLAGPLAHWGLGRTGTVYVIAAGLAYHAGAVNDARFANSHAYGIEAENTGAGEPWPDALLSAYSALCAEIRREHGLAADAVRGHKEVCTPAGRKIDPAGIDMSSFRARVTTSLNDPSQEDDMTPEQAQQLARAEAKLDEVLTQLYGPREADGKIQGWGQLNGLTTVDALAAVLHATTDPIRSEVRDAKGVQSTVTFTPRQALANIDAYEYRAQAVAAQLAGLQAAVTALASSKANADTATIVRAVQDAIAAAVVKVDVAVSGKAA